MNAHLHVKSRTVRENRGQNPCIRHVPMAMLLHRLGQPEATPRFSHSVQPPPPPPPARDYTTYAA